MHTAPVPATTPIDPATQERLARLTARAPGKRHAAKASRAAAATLSVATSLGLSAYFHFADAAKASASPTGTAAGIATAASTSGGSAASTVPSVGSSAANGTGLADGTYLGAADTNRWGPVQVQITVAGGQITAVDAVQTPSSNGKDIAINSWATPILQSEAMAAQSAAIDTVSGATYTSTSYRVSLQSAIDQAKVTPTAG